MHAEYGHRSDELFRLAVDLSPSGLLAVDATGRILLVNREIERMFDYPREALIGRPIEDLVPERFRSGHAAFRSSFHADPQTRPMGAGRDLFGLRRDGTEIPIEVGLNPIHTEQGMFVLGSIVDISARRQSEHQLRQSQKMEAIGTLAGGIAHDFNNILLGIVGHAELALTLAGDQRQLRADLEQVLTAAERGRQLVQRILTFSRQRDVTRVPTPLERPVRESLQLLRASLPATIEIRERIDPNTPVVLSDDTQIHQVIMNLATNASHAMEGGGVLEVRLEPFEVEGTLALSRSTLKAGRYARLSVLDNGGGMALEVLERAFEPFFTTKAPGVGTGLGLSVIHGIVQGQGGAIELRSRPGQGTCVEIYLPALVESEGAASPEAEAPGSVARHHILLVEDEHSLAMMMKRLIESFGHRVTVHTSSLEALEDFRARPEEFDLLVTDNTMPRMTGLALAEEVLRGRPELPVLLISGLATHADADLLRSRGIRKLLPKPHAARELDEAIRELLA